MLLKPVKSLLTFIISKLQVMVHGGHKFLDDEASYDGRQITLALHFAGEGFNVMVWKEESISKWQ